MNWNRGPLAGWGWLILAGFIAASPSFSCQDDEETAGAGAATVTGGSTGGTGALGGAGGSGTGGECTPCKTAVFIDPATAATLCTDGGPPSSKQLFDDLHACACDTCAAECETTVCSAVVLPWSAPCHTCIIEDCFPEAQPCYEDHAAVCEDDGGCNLSLEGCECADCANYSLCNEHQCIVDGQCKLEDACTCEDCWDGSDPECVNPDYCHDDGDCHSWLEGCHCADCADEPNCAGWPGTGGAGGGGGAGGAGGG